jgi:hypothetical protein
VRGSTVVIDEPFCGQGGCDVLRSHAVAVSNRELLEHLNHSPRTDVRRDHETRHARPDPASEGMAETLVSIRR